MNEYSKKLKFRALAHGALLPRRSSKGAAGYDLYSLKDEYISGDGPCSYIATGVAVEIPSGCVGIIHARSSLARCGLQILGGVIDSDYRGEIAVMATMSHGSLSVGRGSRIAQLVVIPALMLDSEWSDALSDTDRGSGGFGSTGK